MRVSRSSTFLFAGTSTGSLRVYNWPPSEEDGEKYIEYYLHSSAIVSVLESMDSKQLTTLGADGSMFVFKIAPKVQYSPLHTAAMLQAVHHGNERL